MDHQSQDVRSNMSLPPFIADDYPAIARAMKKLHRPSLPDFALPSSVAIFLAAGSPSVPTLMRYQLVFFLEANKLLLVKSRNDAFVIGFFDRLSRCFPSARWVDKRPALIELSEDDAAELTAWVNSNPA